MHSNFKLVVFTTNVWPKFKNLETKKYLLFPDNNLETLQPFHAEA